MSGDRPTLSSAEAIVDKHRQPVAANTRKVGITGMTITVSIRWGGERPGIALQSRGLAYTNSSVIELSEVFLLPSGNVER